MNFLGAVILAALFLLAAFTLANWSVLSASSTLSFIAFDVDAPLGVILLGAMLVMLALFILYALALRTSMLMESPRHNQELQAQRTLAETLPVIPSPPGRTRDLLFMRRTLRDKQFPRAEKQKRSSG